MDKKAQIALGTWSWGSGLFGGDAVFGNKLDTPELSEVVETALANGLDLFDTAYAYGKGDSERILGELLKEYERSQFMISDKFTPGLQDDTKAQPLLEMLAGSLKRLGTDYIDLYWIHNAADVERFTPLLIEAVKSGKVKRIGVSNHSLAQVKRVQEILKPAGIKLSAVQNHFSLLYRNSIDDGLLAYCQANGIEFFSYMILEQGALSGKYDKDHLLPADSNRGKTYNPLLPKLNELLTELRNLARTYEMSVAQIVTAWAISKGTTPIIGVTATKQVEEAAKASTLKLTPAEIKILEELAKKADVDTSGGWEGQA